MSTLLEQAIELACREHRGQTDKAGQPYILHPLRLMLRFHTEPERIVAVLHDVVEDGAVKLDQLRELGLSEAVVQAIDHLTRRRDETYDVFIDRVATDALATRVKIEDLRDNLDVSRLAGVSEQDARRLNKYVRALQQLTAVKAQRGTRADAG